MRAYRLCPHAGQGPSGLDDRHASGAGEQNRLGETAVAETSCASVHRFLSDRSRLRTSFRNRHTPDVSRSRQPVVYGGVGIAKAHPGEGLPPMKSVLAAVAILSFAAAAAIPASAQPAFPAQPYERAPPPPPGPPSRFVLEPGHWRWAPVQARYVWVPRHWIGARPGYVHFIPGHWGGGVWHSAHWGP